MVDSTINTNWANIYVDWNDHVTNDTLYGELPGLSNKLRSRRLQFAGHCFGACDGGNMAPRAGKGLSRADGGSPSGLYRKKASWRPLGGAKG